MLFFVVVVVNQSEYYAHWFLWKLELVKIKKHTSVRPVFDLTLGSSHGLYNSGLEVDKCPHKKQIHKLLVVQHNEHTSLKVTMI